MSDPNPFKTEDSSNTPSNYVVARQLVEKFGMAIEVAKGWGGVEGEQQIDAALKQFSPELLHEFWGHGITKGQKIDKIASLIGVLKTHAIKGDTAPLANSGHLNAYTDGAFLLISRKGKGLIEYESDSRTPVFVDLGEEVSSGSRKGVKVSIGAVVANGHYEPLVDSLREMFPNENIIRASELPGYIKREMETKS